MSSITMTLESFFSFSISYLSSFEDETWHQETSFDENILKKRDLYSLHLETFFKTLDLKEIKTDTISYLKATYPIHVHCENLASYSYIRFIFLELIPLTFQQIESVLELPLVEQVHIRSLPDEAYQMSIQELEVDINDLERKTESLVFLNCCLEKFDFSSYTELKKLHIESCQVGAYFHEKLSVLLSQNLKLQSLKLIDIDSPKSIKVEGNFIEKSDDLEDIYLSVLYSTNIIEKLPHPQKLKKLQLVNDWCPWVITDHENLSSLESLEVIDCNVTFSDIILFFSLEKLILFQINFFMYSKEEFLQLLNDNIPNFKENWEIRNETRSSYLFKKLENTLS